MVDKDKIIEKWKLLLNNETHYCGILIEMVETELISKRIYLTFPNTFIPIHHLPDLDTQELPDNL